MIIALKVVLDLMTEFQQDAFLACFSETVSPQIFQYATTQVKDKLLEAGFVHKVFFLQYDFIKQLLKTKKQLRNGRPTVGKWPSCSRSSSRRQIFPTK